MCNEEIEREREREDVLHTFIIVDDAKRIRVQMAKKLSLNYRRVLPYQFEVTAIVTLGEGRVAILLQSKMALIRTRRNMANNINLINGINKYIYNAIVLLKNYFVGKKSALKLFLRVFSNRLLEHPSAECNGKCVCVYYYIFTFIEFPSINVSWVEIKLI